MNTKTIYICENCGKQFDTEEDCSKHEDNCVDKIKLYSDRLSNVIEHIKSEYGTHLNDITFKVTNESFEADEHYYSNYRAEVNFILANGNTAVIQVNPYSSSASYQQIKTEINKRLPTKYEGILKIDVDMGIYDPYIDDIEFLDIAKLLQGRKVRLEVIE